MFHLLQPPFLYRHRLKFTEHERITFFHCNLQYLPEIEQFTFAVEAFDLPKIIHVQKIVLFVEQLFIPKFERKMNFLRIYVNSINMDEQVKSRLIFQFNDIHLITRTKLFINLVI